MTKIEFLQALAKGWFGNSQQHSMIFPHGDFEKTVFAIRVLSEILVLQGFPKYMFVAKFSF